MPNLNGLLQVLQKNKIDFVLIGGFAAVVHGSSQVTQDIDVCTELSPGGIGKLREVLKPFHPRIRSHPKRLSFLEHPATVENIENLYLQTDLGALDLLSQVEGLGAFDAVCESSVEIEVFGKKCRVLSLEGLIKSKEAMNREKDQAVLLELKSLLSNS